MVTEQDGKLRTIFAQNGYQVNSGDEDERLELDSLQFISIICDIENVFEITMPDHYLSGEDIDTFTDVLSIVEKLSKAKE